MTPCHPHRDLVSPEARGGRPGAGDPSSSREAAWASRGTVHVESRKSNFSIGTVVVRPGGAEGSHPGQSRGELRPSIAIAAIMCHGASGSVGNGIGARGGLQPSSVAPPGVSPYVTLAQRTQWGCTGASSSSRQSVRGWNPFAAGRVGVFEALCSRSVTHLQLKEREFTGSWVQVDSGRDGALRAEDILGMEHYDR